MQFNYISSFLSLPLNPPVCLFFLSLKFVASLFSLIVIVCICAHLYIPTFNLSSQYTITCVCIFRADLFRVLFPEEGPLSHAQPSSVPYDSLCIIKASAHVGLAIVVLFMQLTSGHAYCETLARRHSLPANSMSLWLVQSFCPSSAMSPEPWV